MKYLLIGRTASGKDALRRLLEEQYGWTFVKSTTTRPKRSENEDTHLFITKAQAARVPESEKAAKTVIGEFEYFATKSQVEAADAYIIDPKGFEELTANMPNESFRPVYLKPISQERQRAMAVRRASDSVKENLVFDKRTSAEEVQFSRFESAIEKCLKDGTGLTPNSTKPLVFENTYEKIPLMCLAKMLDDEKKAIEISDRELQNNRKQNPQQKGKEREDVNMGITKENKQRKERAKSR